MSMRQENRLLYWVVIATSASRSNVRFVEAIQRALMEAAKPEASELQPVVIEELSTDDQALLGDEAACAGFRLLFDNARSKRISDHGQPDPRLLQEELPCWISIMQSESGIRRGCFCLVQCRATW